MGRVFSKDQGDRVFNPGLSHTKTQNWYLIRPCLTLSIIRYVSRVKWSNPGKGVVPSPFLFFFFFLTKIIPLPADKI